MSIWHQPFTPDDAQRLCAGCAVDHLGIEFLEVGPDFLRGRLPVDQRSRQPYGVLHGGASVLLAETLGSVAANFVVDPARWYCVGQEVNANHLRAVPEGWVDGVARPVHLGRTSQVWDIRLSNAAGQPVCIARLTMAVLRRDGA